MHDSVLSIWHRMTLCNLCWSMWHKLGAMCMYLLEEMSKSDNLDFVWSIKLALLFKTISLLQCSWEKNWKQGNTLVSARLKWRRRERRLVWRFNPPQCGGVECQPVPLESSVQSRLRSSDVHREYWTSTLLSHWTWYVFSKNLFGPF